MDITTTIPGLPKEMAAEIFKHLGAEELHASLQVSHQFYDLVTQSLTISGKNGTKELETRMIEIIQASTIPKGSELKITAVFPDIPNASIVHRLINENRIAPDTIKMVEIKIHIFNTPQQDDKANFPISNQPSEKISSSDYATIAGLERSNNDVYSRSVTYFQGLNCVPHYKGSSTNVQNWNSFHTNTVVRICIASEKKLEEIKSQESKIQETNDTNDQETGYFQSGLNAVSQFATSFLGGFVPSSSFSSEFS